MNTKVEKLEKNKVSLQVEIEASEFKKAVDKAYKKLAKQINIPGFRKGKAPLQMIKNYVGKEALLQEAADLIIPDAYFNAVKEAGIEPIDYPSFDFIQLDFDQDLIFKALTEVKPEVKLGTYKGLSVEKTVNEITAEQVEKELTFLQERHARLESIEEGTVAAKDMAIIDFEGFLDGVPFDGGKGENYSLEIGSGTFIPGFEDGVIGMAVGEEKDIELTFPTEYHAEDLSGKNVVFKVKVSSIKRKEFAPLDDEFAKDISEFDTLEELKADIENKLKKTEENRALGEVKSKLINEVSLGAEVEVPAVMIERRAKSYLEDFKNNLQQQGLTYEKYLELIGQNEDAIMENYTKQAEESVKTDLVLEEIAKVEKIEVTDEDIDKVATDMAAMYKQDKEKIKDLLIAQGSMESIKENILLDKAIDLLVDNASITEVKADEVKADKE